MLLLLTFAMCSLSTYSTNIKFLHTIPENGSDISSFDIKLKFDISEAIVESGNENIAIGYSGNTRTSNAKIYDGSADSGTLLTTVLTKTVKGDADSKDIIDLSIPSSFVPEPGHTYTVVFANNVAMYDLATKLSVANSVINYSASPLIFTFHGGSASADELIYQKASVANNDNIESLNSISFEYNEDLLISNYKPIEIYNGEELIASSKSIEIDPANSKTLMAIFEDVNMYLGKQYTIKLPEGVVCLKSNSSVVNQPIEIIVNGASTIRVATKSISIENNSIVLPDNLTIKFKLDEGLTLTLPGPFEHKKDIELYKEEISSENLLETLQGIPNEDAISWDLSTIKFEPETKYILHKKADDITVWSNGIRQSAYGNEEVIITFTTPSAEDAGFAPMEFDVLKITDSNGENKDYNEGMSLSEIKTLRLALKDKFYRIGNKNYTLITRPEAKDKCKIYEITSSGDKLLTSFDFEIMQTEDKYSIYKIAYQALDSKLYEGKSYKLIIPEGYFSVYYVSLNLGQGDDTSKFNFVMNKEMTYTFKGASSTKSVLLGCNVENESVHSSLYNIAWTFEGKYHLNEDNNSVEYTYVTKDGFTSKATKIPAIVTFSISNTVLLIDLVDKSTGKPKKLADDSKYFFTIPKGTLVNEMNDEIVNDEIVLTVIGGEEALPAVDVNLTFNDLHSASHKAVKGEKYSFTVAPNNDWKVESVMHGDKVLSAKNGVYTTEPLNENAEIRANLEYAGTWADYSETTGVWTVKDTNIRIYSDNQQIVVEGVTPDNEINVYSVSGLHINSTRVAENHDCVRITVATGQVYIVTVDGKAAKIQL